MLELGFSAWGQEGTCQNLRWGPSMEDKLAIFSLVNQPAAMPSSYRLPIPIPRNNQCECLRNYQTSDRGILARRHSGIAAAAISVYIVNAFM
jgi:hypothetical protein